MRDLAVTTLIFASVAWLIPYPGLIWVSGLVWIIAWFALPANVKRSPKGPEATDRRRRSSALRP